MKIVDGNKIGDEILSGLAKKVRTLSTKPKLVIIMVGENTASKVYVEKKRLAGLKVGISVEILKYDESTTEELILLISRLNKDSSVNGIIVQLPLPKGIDTFSVCNAILPSKDVDGLTSFNIGEVWLNKSPKIVPATAKAIIFILKHIAGQEGQNYTEFISGKDVLIINNTQIIGKPLAGLLSMQGATVTISHSKTKDVPSLIKQSDIIISGTGQQNFIQSQEFRKNSVLVDVGFAKTDTSVHGDVYKRLESENLGWLTPVPGGVGPIGVACLIENVVETAS